MTQDAEQRRWGLGAGLSLGISLGGATSPADWPGLFAWVERAELLGLHSVWVPEMHFAPGASASPLLVLGAFAARSQRLRLGTTSLLLPLHDPTRIAEEVTALDAYSGGRLLLGLGRGFRSRVFRAFGVDASAKRDRFDAALDQMLAVWGEPHARTLQPPHPPLAVAAFGPRGLRQAARRGLPYLASPVESAAQIATNLRLHREHLPPGLPPDSLVVPVMRTVHVAGSDAETARVMRALRAETRQIARRVPNSLARSLRAEPEERSVVGTTSECVDRLGALRACLGMDLLITRPELTGAEPAEREASLERLATQVIPQL